MAPAAAPTRAPRFAFALGSVGSVVEHGARNSVARTRTEALRIMVKTSCAECTVHCAQCTVLRLVRDDVDLDAAVQLTAVRGAVRRTRMGLEIGRASCRERE